MPVRPFVPLALATAAVAAVALVPAAGQAAGGRTQTLRFYDVPQSIRLTHPDGTVVDRPPYPEAQPGDVLDVTSRDFAGTHARHAKRWTATTHLRCTFGTAGGPPACESHVALGSSLLVFTGDPGKVTLGTGIYEGATGRVVSSKEVGDDASDIVARITLAR